MSEANARAFTEGESDEEAAALAERLVRSGQVAELVEVMLAAVASGVEWERARVLERVVLLPGPEPLLDPLATALLDNGNAERRNAARSVLAALASPEALASRATIERTEQLTRADDPDARILAASALGESGNPAARLALERLLHDTDPNVVSSAADALGALGDARATGALCQLVQAAEGDFWSRVSAVVALGRMNDPRAVPALAVAVRDPLLAEAAAAALAQLAEPAGLDALRPLLQMDGALHDRAHHAAAAILGSHPEIELPGWLRASLQGREAELADRLYRDGDEHAARLLGIAGTAEAARLLLRDLAPEHRPLIAAGLAMLPDRVATDAILARLPDADADRRTVLLASLPRLTDAAEIEQVARYLADPHDESRAAAVEVLTRSPEELVLPHLLQAIDQPLSRRGAAQALGRLSHVRCDPLATLLQDPDPQVREAAADGLARCPMHPVREQVIAALQRETEPRTRDALVRALGAVGDPAAVEDLAELLSSEDPALRFAAIRALGRTGNPTALPPLLGALMDPLPGVRAAGLHALGELGDPRAAAPVADLLDAPDRDLRRTAAFALRDIAPPEAVERLLHTLADTDPEVRLAAVRTLQRLGANEAADPLRALLDREPHALVRQAAEQALQELGGSTVERAP